jgi:hypothetical protein
MYSRGLPSTSMVARPLSRVVGVPQPELLPLLPGGAPLAIDALGAGALGAGALGAGALEAGGAGGMPDALGRGGILDALGRGALAAGRMLAVGNAFEVALGVGGLALG